MAFDLGKALVGACKNIKRLKQKQNQYNKEGVYIIRYNKVS